MTDRFAHDDAAYVLGALSPTEHAAFEAHLTECADCTARVRELAELPALLGTVQLEDLTSEPEPPPDTLWASLARRAAAERRRRTWITGGLASLAAACAAALIVALWPASSPPAGRPQAMAAVVASPLQATAALTATRSGTEINLVCRYDGTAPPGYTYGLTVVDTAGRSHDLGTWRLAGARTTFASGTALHPDQIALVEITSAGYPVLQLRTGG